MHYRRFLVRFITVFSLFVGLHALIRIGYPLLKGGSFDRAITEYKFPFLAVPLALGVALVQQKKT